MKAHVLGLILLLVSGTSVAKVSAIIESHHTIYRVPAEHQLSMTETLRVKVLDEEGYIHAVYRTYYDAFRKVKSIHYTVYDANGKKIKKLNKADAVDVMVNSSYEIGDARMLYVEPDYRNYPFTVEVEVEIDFRGFLGFPLWLPRYYHDLEVQSASMVLECYNDFAYKSLEINGVAPPVISTINNMKSVRWSLSGLPAAQKQESYRAFVSDQPRVHLTPIQFSLAGASGNFNDWTSFGDWYHDLNVGRNTLSTETKAFLDDVKKKYGSDVKTITKVVYQYMQSKTRYISIQLGIGGYQTIPSDVVERTGYGDCKALTNFMKAMLDHIGISSNCILVNAGSETADIIYNFPSNQFNHVFLAVPLKSDTLWFECTSQTTPPGFLGTFTDDRHVLWVSKGASKIVRTPTLSENESAMKRSANVKLDENGDASIQLDVTEAGAFFDDAMYYQSLGKDRIERFNQSKFSYKDFSIRNFNFSIPNPNVPQLDLKFSLDVRGLARVLQNRLIVPANVLTLVDEELDMDLVSRKCEVRRAFTIDDKVEITLPPNYRLNALSQPTVVESEFGTLHMSIQPEEGRILISRRLVIKKGNYSGEQFDAFNNIVRKIKTIEQTKLVLVSKT